METILLQLIKENFTKNKQETFLSPLLCECNDYPYMVKFTIFRYMPMFNSGEAINIAIVMHDFLHGKLYFNKTSNYQRITSFDNELDVDIFKFVMTSMENYIRKPFLNNLSNQNIVSQERYDANYLVNISKMFLNEYRMSEVMNAYIQDAKNEFESLKNTFLHYDLAKDKRPQK